MTSQRYMGVVTIITMNVMRLAIAIVRPFTVFNYIFNGFTTKIVGRRTKRAGYELHVHDDYRVELNMMLFWLWGGVGTGCYALTDI